MCRHRLHSSQQRNVNYSLLSLVDKVNTVKPVESKDQEVQTETFTVERAPRTRKPRLTTQVPETQVMDGGKTVKFKLTRGAGGLITSFTVLLN